jgi:predicted phage-related endonuclease
MSVINELEFNTAYITKMQKLAELETAKKEIEETSKQVRAELLKAMQDNNLVKVENDYVAITRVAASDSTTLDTKKMKQLEPDKFFELLDEYPKHIVKGESIRIKVK